MSALDDQAEPESGAEPAAEPEAVETERAEEPTVTDDDLLGLLEEAGTEPTSEPDEVERLREEIESLRRDRDRHAAASGFWRSKAERKAEPTEPGGAPLEVAEIDSRELARIGVDAWQDFAVAHPDVNETAIMRHMRDGLRELAQEVGPLMRLGRPELVEASLARGIRETYRHAKLKSELETKRASQINRIQEAKKLSAISGSGGVPTSPAKEKSLEEMSLTELERMLDRMGRG